MTDEQIMQQLVAGWKVFQLHHEGKSVHGEYNWPIICDLVFRSLKVEPYSSDDLAFIDRIYAEHVGK